MINLNNIKQANRRLKNIIHKTPLIYSYSLSELSGSKVYLKLENLQRTGSFKIRGAYNKLSKIRGNPKEVIAASAGNHAQGVALASKLLGINATLVMPEGTPINKVMAVKNYGGKVLLHGNNFNESFKFAKQIEAKSNIPFIHPFDDPHVIAGQGTIGVEILNSLKDLDAVIVPVGGGGLISGISTVLKETNPEIRVVGVQSNKAQSMLRSIKSKKIVEHSPSRSIADGINIKRVGNLTFQIAQKYVDDIITVSDDEIEESLLLLTQRRRIVVEGAGAVGVAALLKQNKLFSNLNTAIVISGGNIDINILSKIIERGLMKSGRLIRLEIELPDIPGSLGKLTSILGNSKANVVEIYHDRFSKKLPIDKAIVEIKLETRGHGHQKEIINNLKKSGYKPEICR